MAKSDNGGKQTGNTGAGGTMTADGMEQRVVAFAEQLGRIVGTVQAKTEGWMDRDALRKQIASVRDSASDLLEQLSEDVTSMTETAKTTAKSVVNAASTAKNKARSGGGVDAPGKKHRKPMPADPRAKAAAAKGSNMRSAKASMKTMKTRGRG
jgi:cell division septum initiation protein DivIVA